MYPLNCTNSIYLALWQSSSGRPQKGGWETTERGVGPNHPLLGDSLGPSQRPSAQQRPICKSSEKTAIHMADGNTKEGLLRNFRSSSSLPELAAELQAMEPILWVVGSRYPVTSWTKGCCSLGVRHIMGCRAKAVWDRTGLKGYEGKKVCVWEDPYISSGENSARSATGAWTAGRGMQWVCASNWSKSLPSEVCMSMCQHLGKLGS